MSKPWDIVKIWHIGTKVKRTVIQICICFSRCRFICFVDVCNVCDFLFTMEHRFVQHTMTNYIRLIKRILRFIHTVFIIWCVISNLRISITYVLRVNHYLDFFSFDTASHTTTFQIVSNTMHWKIWVIIFISLIIDAVITQLSSSSGLCYSFGLLTKFKL